MSSVLHVYNTLNRSLEPVVPEDPARVTFYSCGPTVYDDAHIGNFRSFLAADVLRRWIESPLCALANDSESQRGGAARARSGRSVIHVMNITDVGHMTDDAEGGESGEDRMVVAGRRIAEAKKAGTLPPDTSVDPADPYQIARFYEDRFKADARKLGLKMAIEAERDATLMPRATENIPGMIAAISRLIRTGHAYVVGEPGGGGSVVYFRVRSFPAYGRLSGNTLDALRAGEGGRVSADNQSHKEHPADFLLWKEDPRHIMKWDSPWGTGYPGWHIECTAMSVSRLHAAGGGSGSDGGSPPDLTTFVMGGAKPLFDIHSGGEDNIFPHHECEIAQSCCAFNADPAHSTLARVWFHARFLLVEGAKMSKSKGNFYTARDLFALGHEPAAVRLELIRTHYRSNANFTMQGLRDSARMVDRWRRIAAGASGTAERETEHPATREAREQFTRAMNDDLNVAAAIAAVNTWAGAFSESDPPGPNEHTLMSRFDDVLGVLALERPAAAHTSLAILAPGVQPSPDLDARLEARAAARKAKDFAASDRIRDELLAMGYAIKDAPGGKVEVSRRP